MLAPLTDGISGPDAVQINWTATPSDIVTAVEEVFNAIVKQDASEAEQINQMLEALGHLGEAAGLPAWLAKGAALAAFAPFAAIGAGYMEAGDKIKTDCTPISLAEGIALGARAAPIDFVTDAFWMKEPDPNPAFEHGGEIMQYYTNGALVLGYGMGQALQGQYYPVLIADLKAGMAAKGDTHLDDDLATLTDPADGDWDRNTRRGLYISLASAFVLVHVNTT
jgi:hypothetical protein